MITFDLTEPHAAVASVEEWLKRVEEYVQNEIGKKVAHVERSGRDRVTLASLRERLASKWHTAHFKKEGSEEEVFIIFLYSSSTLSCCYSPHIHAYKRIYIHTNTHTYMRACT